MGVSACQFSTELGHLGLEPHVSEVKCGGRFLVQPHVKRGSRMSEVKHGPRVLEQLHVERDSRVLELRREAGSSATPAFERQCHVLKEEHEHRI